ncbi:MAG: tetratricopeptide repeat protein [Deltaproteobacteria bacterium]|nr:tetratricopeptide repeat protein [Deltaproteobacteria bacterium]
MMGFARVSALLVLSLGVAVAQPKPSLSPPTPAQKTDIERLAKQAIAKSQKGDHEGAIKDYLDAYAIAPTALGVLLSNVGHEYKELKKPYEALKYFCMYLEKEPTGSAANYVLAEASGIWKELGGKEGEVCVKKPEPPPPELKPDPKPDPNGQVTGTTTPPRPPPKETGGGGGGLKIAGLGIAGAGVVALAAGVFFGSKAASKSDQITQGPPIDPETGMQVGWGPNDALGWDGIVQLEKDGEKAEQMQIILTAVGGAMIIGGTALYFVARSKKSGTSEVRVSATGAPGAAGLLLNGRF